VFVSKCKSGVCKICLRLIQQEHMPITLVSNLILAPKLRAKAGFKKSPNGWKMGFWWLFLFMQRSPLKLPSNSTFNTITMGFIVSWLNALITHRSDDVVLLIITIFHTITKSAKLVILLIIPTYAKVSISL
jgi:hypothetical protein